MSLLDALLLSLLLERLPAINPGGDVDHKIVGTVMPVLEMQLGAGETIVAESGELSWLSAGVGMATSTRAGGGSHGLFKAVKRALGGGSFFMTEYSGPGMVAFATKVPGSILPMDIQPGRDLMIHHHGFLCGTPGVDLSIGFQQSLGSGLFGGDGFILQKVSGTGQAWVELDGEVVEYQLEPGQQILVHPGHVGMFEASVAFTVTHVPGIRNIIFGSDGLFLVGLTGPGHIWLQSLPLPNLAHSLTPYLPQPQANSGPSFQL